MNGAMAMAPRTGLRPVRGQKVEIGIWDLLQWAFQREFAGLDFDEVGTEVRATAGFGMEYLLLERARLGCKVDGGGRSDPHPDADVVASALAALPMAYGGRPMAVYIAELARTGQVPDWMPDAMPRLGPAEIHENQHAVFAKTADAAKLGAAGWPHSRRVNRLGRAVDDPVLYCPVVWRPSQDKIAAARRGYLDWWGALDELRHNLSIWCHLTAFEVTDRMPPMTPWKKTS